MDEEELMYRLMNEEDPWYMGSNSGDYKSKDSKKTKKTPPEKKKSR